MLHATGLQQTSVWYASHQPQKAQILTTASVTPFMNLVLQALASIRVLALPLASRALGPVPMTAWSVLFTRNYKSLRVFVMLGIRGMEVPVHIRAIAVKSA